MLENTISIRYGDLKEGKPIRLNVSGKEVVLVMVSGKVYAMDAACSHEGAPLEQGTINGYHLTCPWHQAIFDIRTGKAAAETNWATDIRSYKVLLDEKSGQISISASSGGTTPNEHHDNKQAPKMNDKNASTKDQIIELELLEKVAHKGTDVMSFKFSRRENEKYEAGQYCDLDVGTTEDPKGPTRTLTIASSPTEKGAFLISTRIRDTPFKQKLATLEKGAAVRITVPAGDFTLPKDHSRSVVFLSGGIGVTPFRSMAKYATDKQLPLKITMFDSNRDQANILYKDEFDSWTKVNKNLKIIYTITGEGQDGTALVTPADKEWDGERGLIDRAMLLKHLARNALDNSLFYLCGPPAMLSSLVDLLRNDLKVSEDNIKTEEFAGY